MWIRDNKKKADYPKDIYIILNSNRDNRLKVFLKGFL